MLMENDSTSGNDVSGTLARGVPTASPSLSTVVLQGISLLDRFDRDLLSYIVSWAPYGLPPAEELLPKFGVPSKSLASRICDIARAQDGKRLTLNDRVLLERGLAVVMAPRRGPADGRPTGTAPA